MKTISISALLLSCLFVLTACGGGGSGGEPVLLAETTTTTAAATSSTSTSTSTSSTAPSTSTSTSTSTAPTTSTSTSTSTSTAAGTSTSTAANTSSTVTTTTSTTATSLRPTPESGYRVNFAAIPFATVDSNGTTYLGYQDLTANGMTKFQSSPDGLMFSNPVVLTYNNRSVDSRKTLMPDGKTWRLYQWNQDSKTFTSHSSNDGNVFTADSGIRYTPTASDNNTVGVYDSYVAPDNSVILVYLGDLMGKNNLRMARSTDNGLTFTFYKSNVLGDDNAGGGPNSFVDNKTLLLPDGRRRMMAMRKNEIHSFITTDGYNYTPENIASLKTSDFASLGVTIYSLNDPVLVRTKDGKYRVYVAAATSQNAGGPGNTAWAIVSAIWPD